MATWSFIKILQDWDTKLQNGLNSQGQFIGDISPTSLIGGRGEIGNILQNIDDGGIVLAPGIDFSRPYVNKDTDHIDDGAGSPLAGGVAAFTALVASDPNMGQTIRYDGTDWTVVSIAQAENPSTSQWINGYDAVTGTFSVSQPAFSDLSGAATAAQVPPLSALSGSVTPAQVPALSALSGAVTAGQVPSLSALSGRITTGQLPTGLFSGTVALAKLTVSGTDGSLTLVNGSVSAYTPPT
jgi:hypothetical protein